MFQRGRRGSQEPPEWGLDAETRLKRLGLTKRELAEMLGVNYQHMNGCITGNRTSPAMEAKVLNKIKELEGVA